VERVVLLPEFVQRVDEEMLKRVTPSQGIVLRQDGPEGLWEETVATWDAFSGAPIPMQALERVLRGSVEFWSRPKAQHGTVLALAAPSAVQQRVKGRPSGKKRLNAAVFGLGNLAKATLLPCIRRHMNVACVHELDPTQLGKKQRLRWPADTSPVIGADEDYDVYFIAGYHHTHADLAATALRKGAYVVCEKPLVTTAKEYATLRDAVEEHAGRFFACFQMRYGPLWTYAREDLGARRGEPIHYQCIVFESPLPANHWYNWPNSGSRLVSNGCHWLDHFLFLNDFTDVQQCHVWEYANEDLAVKVELVNGAGMNMVLTQQGSPRIGIQEHVELRANGVTVRVDNSSWYSAEGPERIVRRKRSRRLVSHATMYERICQTILAGEAGDSLKSVERSCRLLLDLEAQLQS
jgi:predicted dehydrogenase